MEKKGEAKMTKEQKELIECMNEFCTEKFDLSCGQSTAEADKYIEENIEQYFFLTMNDLALENGYF